MELKDKQKTVKVVGAAEEALNKLEEQIHSFEAMGKTPAKVDVQLLKAFTEH